MDRTWRDDIELVKGISITGVGCLGIRCGACPVGKYRMSKTDNHSFYIEKENCRKSAQLMMQQEGWEQKWCGAPEENTCATAPEVPTLVTEKDAVPQRTTRVDLLQAQIGKLESRLAALESTIFV